MAVNQNFFALLGDNEESDASTIIANFSPNLPVAPQEKPAEKLVKQVTPSAESVQEAQKSQSERGRGRGVGRGRVGVRGRGDESDNRGYTGGRGRGGNFNLPAAEGSENGPPAEGGPAGGYRGRGFGGRRGRGRGGRGRDGDNNEAISNGAAFEEDPTKERVERFGGADRGSGGRGERFERVDRGDRERGGERGERDRDFPPRARQYDRRNTTGRSFGVKRDGAGRGNWGTPGDDVAVVEEGEQAVKEEPKVEGDPEAPKAEAEGEESQEKAELTEEQKEKEREDRQMTLDEYEKVLVEKRKALAAMKNEERKVKPDKTFETMERVEKKAEEDVFVKLGSEKSKKKEAAQDDKSKKAVSINEFLKAESESNNYRGGGRNRGARGGGLRGSSNSRRVSAPEIADPKQFPTLGGGK